MKINNVGENRIDIYLTDFEIENIFGGYEFIDYDVPECRAKIHKLLSSVIPEALLPLDCTRILIEVKPLRNGCTISFTKIYRMAKRFRAIKKSLKITMVFKNSEDLIGSIKLLCELDSSSSQLYESNSKYAVIASLKRETPQVLLHISEFCTVSMKECDAARIQEYWRPICKRAAISHLSLGFLK